MVPVAAALLLVVAAGADAPAARESGITSSAPLGFRALGEADFREHLAGTRSPGELAALDADPVARREALEAWLDALALAARARHLGIDREPRFRAALALAEQKLLAQLVAERHAGRLRGAPVTEEELRQRHAADADALAEEPRFTGRHLVAYVEGNPAFPERGRPDGAARARAEAALARLRAGEGWETVARALSDEPGTSAREGVVRDVALRRLAPEVERAARTQPLGVPGPPFRSGFGWHVLQVDARVTERTPRPFEEVREGLAGRLAGERAAAAREAFVAAVRAEVGVRVREAGLREVSLLDERAVARAEVLADVDGEEVRESDFRWFLEDALLPGQRARAWSRPGARRTSLAAFLDLRVLAAKARREGLDRTDAFARRRGAAEDALLREFAEAREGVAPPGQCTAAGPERQRERRAWLDRVRAAVGLRPHPPH